jgi:ATP-binding cassette subfamily B protein
MATTAAVNPHKAGTTMKKPDEKPDLRSYLGVFRYSKRALGLVWSTSRGITLGLAFGSLLAGLLPTAIAYISKRLIDAVVHAHGTNDAIDRHTAMMWVGAELGIVVFFALTQRTLGIFRSLIRQQLGQRINVEILEKSLTLELTQFEDSELYDKLTRARREASSRPLSLVSQTFELGQSIVTLIGLGGLLAGFSPLALAILFVAAIPPGSARGSSRAIARSSTSCTRAIARSRSTAACGGSCSERSATSRSTACTCGSRCRRSTATSRSAR